MKRSLTLLSMIVLVGAFFLRSEHVLAEASSVPMVQKKSLDRIVTPDGLITVVSVQKALSETLRADVSSVELFPGKAPFFRDLLWKQQRLTVEFVMRRQGVHAVSCAFSYSPVSVDALAFLVRSCTSETADLSSFYMTRQSILGISKD